jgi:GH43 family beta-xylosidase
MSVSCNSDQMKKVFGQDKFNGALEYKISGEEFREDLGNLVDNDKVYLGYSMDGKITGNTYSFFITFENPTVDLEDENAVVQLTERVNPVIGKHISNLDKYGSYQVQFTKSEESDNIEKKKSVIVTQEITTTRTDESK